MYAELKEYLLINNKLPFPGFGSFVLQRTPAQGDFPNRIIHAPQYTVSWNAGEETAPERLWAWLGHFYGISDNDARHKLEKFIYEIRSTLDKGDYIEWNGIGRIEPGTNGQLQFRAMVPLVKGTAVNANKVLREKAEHNVRVGEDERTAVQMTEILSEKPIVKFRGWWIGASLVAVITLGYIAWYLGHHNWNLASMANQHAIDSSQAATTSYIQP